VKKKLLCLSFVILFGFATSICTAKYSGGNGSESTPYRISNAYDMNAIGADSNDWDKHFVLTNDIDLAQFTGTQFNIIGTWGNSFTGVFDGNDFAISNFTYNSPGTYAGIFCSVGSPFDPNGEIKNLGLIDPNVNAGDGGTLVASLGPGGTISNCYVEGGQITGIGRVGGLVGYNDRGTIANCDASGTVTGTSRDIGGLAGRNSGTISNCYATGNVSGNKYVGGLVGDNWGGTISNCYATSDVVGNDRTGGLVGYNCFLGTIENCHATVTVSGGTKVGGLVGWNIEGTISNCYATGTVEGNGETGGLVGYNYSSILDCYADVNVSSTGPETGGLVGKNLFGTILDCNAIGNVSASADKTGGLVGYNYRGTIANCFTTGNVDGTSYVGGLIGEDASDSNISNCHTTGNISGTGDYVGGLRGKGSSEIFECYTTGSVSGGNCIGGLAGGGDTYMGSISNCYSTGDVNGNDYTGGLMGFCGIVRNSYATGSVNGNDYTGGLVGRHQSRGTGPIANCYATGDVNGNNYTGGLVGSGIILDSYATGSVNGNDYTGGLAGNLQSRGPVPTPNCYATGDVNGNDYTGGLAGYGRNISNCYAAGNVNGHNYTGGLAGYLEGMISNCYATGAVDGNDSTGGLAGRNYYGTIYNCYAAGDVNGNDCTGGLVGFNNFYSTISNCYSSGDITGDDPNTGGLVGYDYNFQTFYTKCFWDSDINSDVNGIGNITDPPDVIGETTENMQTESTFTDAGWDFVGETDNGSDDIWKMCYDPDYPHLFWEQCPRPSLEMPMHFTPRTLNPKSKGKWVKAHFVLPEGFTVEDVNTNSPARIIEPFTADSNYMDVFLNEGGLVKIMAAFDRAVFCSNGSAQGNVVVIGRLTNSQYFYGTDTIRIKTNNLEYLAVLTSHWLRTDCKKPHWCEDSDINQDGTVDFIDFALFDGCCLEFIQN